MYRKYMAYILCVGVLLFTGCGQTISTHDTKAETQESNKELVEFEYNAFRDAYYNHTFDKIDFTKFADSTNNLDTREADGDLWYSYYIYFSYDDIYYWIQASYTENNQLDAVYIKNDINGDVVILYDNYVYKNDLDEFVSRRESLDKWLTVTLPEKYTIGELNFNQGISGGAVILPEVYPMSQEIYDVIKKDIAGSDLDATTHYDEWRCAGFIGRILATNNDVNIEFLDGVPQPYGLPTGNHFEKRIQDVIPSEKNDGWYIMEATSLNEFYTFALEEELKDAGVELKEADTFSEYWEFYYLKEGNEKYYYLALAKKEFSFEQAEEIAKNVTIIDK